MAEKEYFKKLDFIRIISCLLVLLYHLNIVKGGFLAVCTFFTLSGYLTCISVLGSKEFSIKAYYINKLKKMYCMNVLWQLNEACAVIYAF